MVLKAKRKRCTLHFNQEDVARVCNIHRNTVRKIQNKTGKDLRKMSLEEILEFIDKYKKEKGPEAPINFD